MSYKINKKAPRMRKAQFATHIFTKELFKRFKQTHPEYRNMDWKTFSQRWAEIAETIRNESVMNPLGVKLSFYLGELKTQFLPYKYKATDLAASTEAEEKVAYLNLVTRGKVAKIKWERRWAVKFNKILQFYAFESDRKIKELAKKYVPENSEKIRIARKTLGGKRFWK